MSTISSFTRDESLEVLRSYQKDGKLFSGARQKLAAEDAADALEAGKEIRIAGPFSDDVVGTTTALQTLDTLVGSAKRPNLERNDILALKALAVGMHEKDGAFSKDGQQLDAYQLHQSLPHSVTIRCGQDDRPVQGMDQARGAYSWILKGVTPPIAETPPKELVKIVPGKPEHAATIEALERMSFQDAWPESTFRDLLSKPDVQVSVGMSGAGAVGFIIQGMGRRGAGTANLDDMCVAPQARGKKVGEQLFLRAVQNARGTGAPVAFLEVDVTNIVGVNLYTKAGFKVVQMLPNYYAKVGHDGYLMQLTDLQSDEVGQHLDRLQQEVAKHLGRTAHGAVERPMSTMMAHAQPALSLEAALRT